MNMNIPVNKVHTFYPKENPNLIMKLNQNWPLYNNLGQLYPGGPEVYQSSGNHALLFVGKDPNDKQFISVIGDPKRKNVYKDNLENVLGVFLE